MMRDGMGGTVAVLHQEASRDRSVLTANTRREPGPIGRTISAYPATNEVAECRGIDDLCLAGSLSQQARLCRERGEDDRAEPLLERALALQEQTVGPAHPHVAITLTHLMYVYRRQGKEAPAAAAQARATQILAGLAREETAA